MVIEVDRTEGFLAFREISMLQKNLFVFYILDIFHFCLSWSGFLCLSMHVLTPFLLKLWLGGGFF